MDTKTVAQTIYRTLHSAAEDATITTFAPWMRDQLWTTAKHAAVSVAEELQRLAFEDEKKANDAAKRQLTDRLHDIHDACREFLDGSDSMFKRS